MNAAEFSALPDVQRLITTATAYQVLGTHRQGKADDAMGGRLLISATLDERAFAYSVAMSIAGGAFLSIERRPERLKEALRNSVCDYMVNSLDEALRVLKNDIRKKTPVSVGLLGDAIIILREAEDRGVQPEYVLNANSAAASDETMVFGAFFEHGAVDITRPATEPEPVALVAAVAESPSSLRAFERAVGTVLAASEKGSSARRKWAESSARYLRRTAPPMRSAFLSEQEMAALERELRQQPADGKMVLAIHAAGSKSESGPEGAWRLKEIAAIRDSD